MRNILLFIRRYFTFVAFLVLQFIALWMLFNYNRFHRTVGSGVANQFTGTINKQVDRLDDYFHQGEENKRVHRTNDSLLNLLRNNFYYPDTIKRAVTDSVMIDSVRGVRRYYWLDAKVVYNTVNFDKNYLQLDRGSKYGIKDNMAVLSSEGHVVGVVVNVSPNFSQVMGLLHVQSSVSASLKNTGESGRVEWDGKDPKTIILEGIPKSVPVKIGDTVSGIANDPATGFYLLRVRPAVNFSSVQQVFVVENLQREEQEQLEKDTEKKIDQQKGTTQ